MNIGILQKSASIVMAYSTFLLLALDSYGEDAK